jgi:CspA family cold shock protein
LTGEVVEFDEGKGYGNVRADDGHEYFFHCTQIADGSRTIAEGTEVTFDITPGHLGRWEATQITPTS